MKRKLQLWQVISSMTSHDHLSKDARKNSPMKINTEELLIFENKTHDRNTESGFLAYGATHVLRLVYWRQPPPKSD